MLNRRIFVKLLRELKPESPLRMRRRVRRAAFLRTIFWQGENPLNNDKDPKLCPSIREPQYDTSLLETVQRSKAEVTSLIRLWLRSTVSY